MARVLCLRMGCLTGCNDVAHTSRLVCSGLVKVIGLCAMIPWGVMNFISLTSRNFRAAVGSRRMRYVR